MSTTEYINIKGLNLTDKNTLKATNHHQTSTDRDSVFEGKIELNWITELNLETNIGLTLRLCTLTDSLSNPLTDPLRKHCDWSTEIREPVRLSTVLVKSRE